MSCYVESYPGTRASRERLEHQLPSADEPVVIEVDFIAAPGAELKLAPRGTALPPNTV
jgi:hypothetical protein